MKGETKAKEAILGAYATLLPLFFGFIIPLGTMMILRATTGRGLEQLAGNFMTAFGVIGACLSIITVRTVKESFQRPPRPWMLLVSGVGTGSVVVATIFGAVWWFSRYSQNLS